MSSEKEISQLDLTLDEDEDSSEFVILNQPPSVADASLVASHFDMVELQIGSCVLENSDMSPQDVDANLKDLVAGYIVVKDKLEERNRLLCEELNSFVGQKEEIHQMNRNLQKMLEEAELKIQKLQEENKLLQNKADGGVLPGTVHEPFELQHKIDQLMEDLSKERTQVTCLKQLLEEKSHHTCDHLPQSCNLKAQLIVSEMVNATTQTPEGSSNCRWCQDVELLNDEGIKNRAIVMETSQKLKGIVQNYNELLTCHEAQTAEMESQSAKFDEARQKEHQLHQEKLDNLTAKLLCAQDQLAVEEHKAHLLKMEINRLERDVEQIPALKAQVEILRKDRKPRGKRFW